MLRFNRNITPEESRIAISIFLVLVITFIAFLPSLENDFINLDDPFYVTENDLITDLSLRGIKNIFTSFHYGLYKPLVLLSFAIEYHFFKLKPFIYHATNLTLHLFNSALVFWMIFLISKNIVVSLATATLFGIHPLHVESVAWVAERKDMLSSLFFLLAAISYFYYCQSKLKRYYFFLLIAFILSLLAKPMGIILPFVFFIFDFIQKRKFEINIFKEKIPFFIIAVVVLVIDTYALRLITERGTTSISNLSSGSFLIAMHGIIFYLKKLFIPLKLSCLYPYPDTAGGVQPIFFYSPAIVIFLAAIVLLVSKYTKKVAFGSLFFIITIFPALQLFPSGPAIAADRYTYIPAIGIFYIFSECLRWLYNRNSRYKSTLKVIWIILFILVITTLSFLTFERTKVWKNSVILWDDAVKKIPRNAIAYANRGGAYAEVGNFQQAIRDCNKAIELDPNLFEAYAFRAGAYTSTANFQQAIRDCNKAIELNPYFARAYYNRAVTCFFKKEYINSWNDVYKARTLGLKINPEFLQALKNASGKEDK